VNDFEEMQRLYEESVPIASEKEELLIIITLILYMAMYHRDLESLSTDTQLGLVLKKVRYPLLPLEAALEVLQKPIILSTLLPVMKNYQQKNK
jgi:hypothetical protein